INRSTRPLRKLMITILERLPTLTEKPNPSLPKPVAFWLGEASYHGRGRGEGMRVEVESSEVHGLSRPRRFRLDGRVVEVAKILDQWFGADYRYCKVARADCVLYILRLDENRSEWTLTMYASPEAQTLAPQSGSTCVRTDNRYDA